MNWLKAEVTANVPLAPEIYLLDLAGKGLSGLPGQFFMLRAWERDPLLSRPLSIYHLEKDRLQFLYRVTGKGTTALSHLKTGDWINSLGPLGKGFSLTEGKLALVAGGAGIAPLSFLARKLPGKAHLYAGYKDVVFGIKELETLAENIFIATETGSYGHAGLVTDIFDPSGYDMVYCCGPEAMMKIVVDKCNAKNIPVQVSLEKHMACGLGACWGCVCQTGAGLKRVCSDGPVFNGDEVIFDG